ncbi:MAG: hypothetical protein ACR2QC_05745 [Gammaproteobacteria bacterium]
MKTKTAVLTIAAAVLSGCGPLTEPQPPGHYVEATREEDFAMSCDDIWQQSEEVKSVLRTLRAQSHIDEPLVPDSLRDHGARLRVLHRWGQKKNCDEQWGLGSFSPDQTAPVQQAPAPREKSRVIICSEGDTCVVE